ncbi:hypothetical protein [Azospirillum palustre]
MSITGDQYSELMQAAYKEAFGKKETVTASDPARSATSVAESESGILSTVSEAAETVWTAVKNNPLAAAGGAVIGVGAIAAAPFTGGGSVLGGVSLLTSLASAVAVTSATAAGVVGAGAVATLSETASKSAERAAFDNGMEKGKAEAAVRMQELQAAVERAAALHADQKTLHAFYVNVAAVGFAMAGCDGTVTTAEKECIKEFIVGVSKQLFPKDIQEIMDTLYLTPPDFDGAMLYAERLGRGNWGIIDGILTVVGEADGDGNEHERDFLLRWVDYKAVRLGEGESA